MKICSWNINGVRSIGDLNGHLAKLDADITCFQETKISRHQLTSDIAKCEGYLSFFNFSKEKQGYSGVATYVKAEYCPFKVELGIEGLTDDEGRVLVSYHERSTKEVITVVNTYVPCAYENDEPSKYSRKLSFINKIKDLVVKLSNEKYLVLVVGDINVKSTLIDSAEAYENRHNKSYVASWNSQKDVCLFNEILQYHLTDSFRYRNPTSTECYTCWNSGLNARVNNYGTRIDYILISKLYETLILSSKILGDIHGSDHCPIIAELNLSDILKSQEIPHQCTLFYPELKGKQAALFDVMGTQKRRSDNQVPPPNPEQSAKKRKVASNKFKTVQTKLKLASQSTCSSKPPANEIGTRKSPTKTHLSTKPNSVSVKSLLVGLPAPPLCTGHNVRATLKTVQKDTANNGRRFYCCSFPIGPSTCKNSRCNFFKWFD